MAAHISHTILEFHEATNQSRDRQLTTFTVVHLCETPYLFRQHTNWQSGVMKPVWQVHTLCDHVLSSSYPETAARLSAAGHSLLQLPDAKTSPLTSALRHAPFLTCQLVWLYTVILMYMSAYPSPGGLIDYKDVA